MFTVTEYSCDVIHSKEDMNMQYHLQDHNLGLVHCVYTVIMITDSHNFKMGPVYCYTLNESSVVKGC